MNLRHLFVSEKPLKRYNTEGSGSGISQTVATIDQSLYLLGLPESGKIQTKHSESCPNEAERRIV